MGRQQCHRRLPRSQFGVTLHYVAHSPSSTFEAVPSRVSRHGIGGKTFGTSFARSTRTHWVQRADSPEWLAWETRSVNVVERICAENSPATALARRGKGIRTSGHGPDAFERVQSSLLKALELTRTALGSDAYGELQGPGSTHASPALSNRVFVVHGHDSEFKTDVERFLHEIGLEPVVLHRQPDEGATIIEKFEKHADAGFAFVLLTPDEVACTVDQENVPEDQRRTEQRARPDVIFEFGYFVGQLGRSRVCCLHKGDVTVPSDLDGLVYKKVGGSIDEQGISIIRELKAAGYTVRL